MFCILIGNFIENVRMSSLTSIITLKASFGKMGDKIHVDVGIGDILKPENKKLKLSEYLGKSFFEESVSLLVYPIETIFAEKLETVLSKGCRNCRMKNFKEDSMNFLRSIFLTITMIVSADGAPNKSKDSTPYDT